MVSKKSRPIKKVSYVSGSASEQRKKPAKSSGLWVISSAVLALLLVISVFTDGFRFNEMKAAEASLKSMLNSNIPESARSSITSALSSLEDAKRVISESPKSNDYKGTKARLEFYVMSQCPYGTQVEDAVKPALDKLGEAVDFSIDFIATDKGNGQFDSLHGQNEVLGNIVQLCAMKYNPDTSMDMITCMNQNAGAIPSNWEKCASDNKLDAAKIKACYEGPEGKDLHSKSILKSNTAGAQASPTMFLNGKEYTGQRDTLSFMRALCAQLGDHPECSKIPVCAADSDCTASADKIGKCTNPNTDSAKCEYVDPNPVNVIILNDKTCAECQQATALITQLQQLFKGLKVTSYDYEDAEGKKLYDELKLTALPAFIFDETVKDGENYEALQRYLQPAANYYNLMIGASHNPMSEICNNGADDRDKDGLVDCADPECSSVWQCMAKKDKPDVELFVMSHCPYGTQTEKGILPAVEALGDNINFNVRFVYYAMHGKTEVDEQARQYCIQKEQRAKYLPYLKCFLEAGDTSGCLSKAGVDKTMMDSCVASADTEFGITANFNDQSKWLSGRYPLFNTDKALNDKYSVGGSPTLVINGVTAEAGRDPQSMLDAICTGFSTKPSACSQPLSASAYDPGFGFTQSAGSNNIAAGCG